jgi:hypothetical protein
LYVNLLSSYQIRKLHHSRSEKGSAMAKKTVMTVLLWSLAAMPATASAAAPGDETPPATSAAASGSAPLESVTVTASKPSKDAIASFVASHATATRMTGKLARWKTGICPLTVGLGVKFASYVTKRVRDVAASVGAPVNKDADCKTNIRIVFTTTPQELLDTIRKDQPAYLGYFDDRLQSARLATVTHAIQSWYTTATEDNDGHPEVDSPHPGGVAIEMPNAPPTGAGGIAAGGQPTTTMNLPYATIKSVTGGRLGDGLSSEFFNVIIVAEPAKLMDFEIGTLADYIAMLALSQPGNLDSCEALPSITNLLSPGCSTIARTITEGDLAYLRGLYKMSPAGSVGGQRAEVRYQMEQALKPEDH